LAQTDTHDARASRPATRQAPPETETRRGDEKAALLSFRADDRPTLEVLDDDRWGSPRPSRRLRVKFYLGSTRWLMNVWRESAPALTDAEIAADPEAHLAASSFEYVVIARPGRGPVGCSSQAPTATSSSSIGYVNVNPLTKRATSADTCRCLEPDAPRVNVGRVETASNGT
jgi:hypothetical protein